MYQMTLFFEKVIYKNNNYLITHQKDMKLHHFFQIFMGWHAPRPP